MVSGVMAGTDRASLGAWASSVPDIRAARADELPAGHGPGIRARIPLVDMPVLLRHLRRRLEAAGGRVELRTVTSLAEAAAECPLVVNCTGLGARDLVPDPDMTPVRGQLVVVENPGVEGWYVAAGPDTSDTVYLLPQPYGLLLGGTAEEGCWDTTPDPAVARAIVRRCSRIRPELEGARVIAHRVGLRPARSQVRLEAETLPGGGRCVHNYGHGGAGVTVAWGCAEEAAGLLDAGAPLR